MAGQATPAIALLVRQRIDHREHTYSVDADTANCGAAVADARGVELKPADLIALTDAITARIAA
ncbi:MAG: hypothetical protein IRY85_12940 [Micromonosporaceae bacterium]|nr:hypothetical protein [Micromonosporaceae bacterium]